MKINSIPCPTLQEIEAAIERLSPEEIDRLAGWFEERFQSHWDRQLEDDASSGRLDDVYDRLVRKDGGEEVPLDDFLDGQKLS